MSRIAWMSIGSMGRAWAAPLLWPRYYGLAIIASVDQILRYARQKQNDIIALIRELVEHESPSDHAASVNRFVEVLVERSRGLARVRAFPGGAFGKHLHLEFALP